MSLYQWVTGIRSNTTLVVLVTRHHNVSFFAPGGTPAERKQLQQLDEKCSLVDCRKKKTLTLYFITKSKIPNFRLIGQINYLYSMVHRHTCIQKGWPIACTLEWFPSNSDHAVVLFIELIIILKNQNGYDICPGVL